MKARQAVAIVLVLAAALALRLAVVAAIPHFFGSGDPSVYYAAARGCLSHGVPRIDCIWHFATWPPGITHIEDYCEPAFAYLLAVPMAVLGPSVIAAKMLSVACGTLAAWLAFRFTRRFGATTAVLAAALVAFDPWSIYYGGLIMKEAAVSAVVLLFFAAARRVLAAAPGTRRPGVALGLLTVAAGLVQYELLPVLAPATAATLWIHHRRLVWPYVAATTAATVVLLTTTWGIMGVPISAKLYFFAGRSFFDPSPTVGAPDPVRMVLRFLPLQSLPGGIMGWYPIVLVLGLLGAREARVPRAEFTLLAGFGLAFVYFHAVPGDLWQRFFIPATAVFATYAAIGIASSQGWLARAWSPAVTAALLAFALVAPRAYALAARLLPGGVPLGFGAAVLVAGTVGTCLIALLAMRDRIPLARLKRIQPALLVLAVALNYHASLPWWTIRTNPQMPGFEALRVQRERVCRRIRGVLAGAPLMATAPAEVNLYTGSPSVLLPDSPAGIRAVRARYRPVYLLVRTGILAPGVIDQVPVAPVLAVEDYTLYRFVGD